MKLVHQDFTDGEYSSSFWLQISDDSNKATLGIGLPWRGGALEIHKPDLYEPTEVERHELGRGVNVLLEISGEEEVYYLVKQLLRFAEKLKMTKFP